MKVAVTSKGKSLDSPVDPRFGRAEYILIVDMNTESVAVIENSENANAFKGAGIQAAAAVADKGVDILLTGFCGPNAFKTLSAAGVKVVNDITGSVKDALTVVKKGELKFADGANAEGHW